MPSLTIGTITIAIVQFIVIMGMLSTPLSFCSTTNQCILPLQFRQVYFGNVNATTANFTSKIQVPIQGQANGTTGFNSITPNVLQNFGGVAFIYTAFGAFMNSLINFPTMLYYIFTTAFAYPPLSWIVAGGTLLSIGIFAYVSILIVYKGIGMVSKVITEET